jgi:hypothetical protein
MVFRCSLCFVVVGFSWCHVCVQSGVGDQLGALQSWMIGWPSWKHFCVLWTVWQNLYQFVQYMLSRSWGMLACILQIYSGCLCCVFCALVLLVWSYWFGIRSWCRFFLTVLWWSMSLYLCTWRWSIWVWVCVCENLLLFLLYWILGMALVVWFGSCCFVGC